MGEKIGILGGAFDPPHVGHLILGQTALEQLALRRVLFLPTGEPPHKAERSVTDAAHRLAMTQRAVSLNDAFEVSAIDMERPVPHYTYTLRSHVERLFPHADFYLIIGGDSLRDLPEWREPQQIVRQWRLAVLPRPDSEIDLTSLERSVPGVLQVTTLLDGPSVALSSTQIRRWVKEGRSLRYLTLSTVAEYIRAHELYVELEPGPAYSSDSAAGGTA